MTLKAVMEMNELDDDEFHEDTMFCPHCTLPLYQKDDKKRIFLFICRTCGYEANLDYEFTWEKEKVNGISILPHVKRQYRGACFPNAILTTVESKLIAREAVKREKFADKLSVDDIIQKYEDMTGVEFGAEDGEYKKRMKYCRDIMEHQGVFTTKGNGPYKAESSWKSGASFADISELLVKGVLVTTIPVTAEFSKLSPDDIYIADVDKVLTDENGGESWHAIVLVGFGSRNNEKYFRFMNSWGTKFCDKGFGSIRALEIKDVLIWKLKH